LGTRPLVLIADDNPGMVETLADIVAAAGFEVDTAPDGEAALALLRSKRYDVAVFDIVMPGINGVELIRRCRAEKLAPRFIAITAYTGSEYVNEARAEGAEAVLAKPLDPALLITALHGPARPG